MSIRLPYSKNIGEFMRWSRLVIERLNDFFATHSETSRPVTITVSGSVTASTITDSLVTQASLIIIMPIDTNAKGKGWYVVPTETVNGSTFILRHDTISLTAQFMYLIAT